jgi:cytochrome c553
MKVKKLISGTFLGAIALLAATAASAAGNAQAGSAKSMFCAGCHGVDGNVAYISARLAGQSTAQFHDSLMAFKAGKRFHPVMNILSLGLTEQSASAAHAPTTSRTSIWILPRDKLIVITGLSGSGKSSLAFDTLYAEGQRRYVESLSAYARQFLSQLMEKPDVDHIEGLSPGDLDRAEVHQRTTRAPPSARSPRSTTTCACCLPASGTPRCPDHHGHPLEAQTVSQMVDRCWRCPRTRR